MSATTLGVFVASAIVVIIIIDYLLRLPKLNVAKRQWRTLVTDDLKFVDGADLSVEGNYCDCYLELYLISSDTYLDLTANNPIKDMSVSEIKEGLQDPIAPEQMADSLTKRLPVLKGTIEVAENGQGIHYKQRGIEESAIHLKQLFDLFSDLIINVYPQIIVLGGEIVPLLHTIAVDEQHALRPVAIQWLCNIEAETEFRLGHQTSDFLCPSCLIRCAAHQIDISSMHSVKYYGCRSCGQSQEFMNHSGPIIARLDNQMTTKILEQEEVLIVNWFAHQSVFDFDKIQIIRATDEEVERFVVNLGNNSDELQQSSYKKMNCVVLSACSLSDNTMRILKHRFGQIMILEDLNAI
jgi:hypothetical protein